MILASRGFRSKELVEMHKEHPILRTGPRTLSYGDIRAIKDIYGHGTKCTKDRSYSVSAGAHFHLADVVDKAEHARKRKVLSSAYALKNLEGWEYKVSDKVERLLAHLDRVCSEAPAPGTRKFAPHEMDVDIRAWTNFFTLEAIADIGLSTRLGFLDRGNDTCFAQRKDGSTYETSLREALYPTARKQSLIVWNYDWYPVIDKLVNVIPFFGRMQQSAENWTNIVWALSVQRLKRYEAGEQSEDFFQALMEGKSGSPNNLEMGEIAAEVNIMMNAGSVTTAIAIANVIYQLTKNPDCLKALRKEVDAVLEPDELVAPYEKVKHLPYLRACLDESLRLFPPTPHGLPREVPPEGMHIMGEWIPGGTTVSMSALVVHHDEKVFPEADKYIPDRWLGESGKALQPYFLSFSAGARSCIGRNISYLEQTKLVATLVHRYEWALQDPDWELKRLETMNLLLYEMPIKVWRRQVG